MRVLVFDGPHRLHVEERALPTPAPDEVRVRVAYAGICGSDLHGYTGETGRRVRGTVMGHEASGWVDSCGTAVEGPTPGQPVTFIPTLPCPGDCGHTAENTCTRLQLVGITPSVPGAFADAIVVPAARVVPVGSLDLTTAAAAEPFAVGLHAVRRARVRAGNRVLVTGGGMIGLCSALAAYHEGAAEVVVSEPLAPRRELAAALGARSVEPNEVMELGSFDSAVDAVGVSATVATVLSAIPPGGTACVVGLGSPEVTLPLFDAVTAERTVVGSFAYPDSVFREAVELLVGGAVDLSPLLGTVVSLDDAPAAFAGLADGSIDAARVTVTTGSQAA